MGRQHTAKNGKPGFESFKSAKRVKKKVTKNKALKSHGLAKKVISGNDDMVLLQAAHQPRCSCVTCLITKGDKENQARISARPHYKGGYYGY